MIDREKVIRALEVCSSISDGEKCPKECPYIGQDVYCIGSSGLMLDAIDLLKEQEKEIKALHLLVEWAEECDFGFDQFPDEYERYKDEIKDMKYIDGMIHIAKRTLEDNGAFEEGR